MDYLSQLPIDMFLINITYLPYDDVINVCQANKKLYSYCTDIKYNSNWKSLIDNAFSNIYTYYQDKLEQIWIQLKLSKNTYNYLVYANLLITLLDPITKLHIYYRQGDKKSFNNTLKWEKHRFTSFVIRNYTDRGGSVDVDMFKEEFDKIFFFLPERIRFGIVLNMLNRISNRKDWKTDIMKLEWK